jgi:TrmH family RNA methyltransferase
MAIRIVQSKQNARVKELRAALLHPERNPSGPVGLEGLNLLTEALRSPVEIQTVFIAQGHEKLLGEFQFSSSTEILAVPFEVLTSAVTTEAPQPIAALLQPRKWGWPDLISTVPRIVVLSGIQDPGNLGTILRSAEAFGATGAVCLPGTVSPWNPKALRASTGSIFRLPLISASESDCIMHLRQAKVRTIAAIVHDAQPLGELDLSGPIALFIGSEGSGLSPDLAAQCDARITIPMPGPTESLNAAVAASILLYEASRQRTTSAPKGRASNRHP